MKRAGSNEESDLKRQKKEKYEMVFEHVVEEEEDETEDTVNYDILKLIEEEEEKEKSLIKLKQSLPIYAYRQKILDAIEQNPVIILVGETGCGKTTQVPQYLFEEGKRVCCTQPRRVAATSVAQRVAVEVGCKIGEEVGYAVRFDKKASKKSRIKYVTDGILVREFSEDNMLSKYDVIMVDEAHERTLNTDILLGLLKQLVSKRSDLRIIIASATIDADVFSNFFGGGTPIIRVPGRTFPVEVMYAKQEEADYVRAALSAVLQIHQKQGPGDILVFLTGQEEIETLVDSLDEACRRLNINNMRTLPLYAGLPTEEQALVFEPPLKGMRKVVVSTNIAETSVTIPGVVYVVDSGMAKNSIWDSSGRGQVLVVEPCARAAADQRKGRAGRVCPGKCYRLYTRKAYLEMRPSAVAEILRCDMSGVVLLLLELGIHNLLEFPLVEKPSIKSLASALDTLYALGAISTQGQLTERGQKIAKLPLGPIMGRCILEAVEMGPKVAQVICTVVGMLESSNSQEVWSSKRGPPPESISVIGGDMLTMYNLWVCWKKSGSSRGWCRDRGVAYRSLIAADRIRFQLLKMLHVDWDKNDISILEEIFSIKCVKALCAGLFLHKGTLSQTAPQVIYSTPHGPTTLPTRGRSTSSGLLLSSSTKRQMSSVIFYAPTKPLYNAAVDFYKSIGFKCSPNGVLTSNHANITIKLDPENAQSPEDIQHNIEILKSTTKDWRTLQSTIVMQSIPENVVPLRSYPNNINPTEIYTLDPLGTIIGFTSNDSTY
ncbi:hypothetical protein CANINC_003673, partial [Pichia inconspicua]